jgi:hypothetical protein
MIVHLHNFGLEQSFKSFFDISALRWFSAISNSIRLLETESKVTRTNIAFQICGETRTPTENISAPPKILNLMSDCHVISAVWS